MMMKNHKNGREKKLLQLVLLIGTVGATQWRRKSKAKPGDIMLYDGKERRPVIHELYTIPGVAALSDFIYEKSRRFLRQGGALEQRLVRVQTHTCFSLLSRKSRIQKEMENG